MKQVWSDRCPESRPGPYTCRPAAAACVTRTPRGLSDHGGSGAWPSPRHTAHGRPPPCQASAGFPRPVPCGAPLFGCSLSSFWGLVFFLHPFDEGARQPGRPVCFAEETTEGLRAKSAPPCVHLQCLGHHELSVKTRTFPAPIGVLLPSSTLGSVIVLRAAGRQPARPLTRSHHSPDPEPPSRSQRGPSPTAWTPFALSRAAV